MFFLPCSQDDQDNETNTIKERKVFTEEMAMLQHKFYRFHHGGSAMND